MVSTPSGDSFREFVSLLPADGALWVSARSKVAVEIAATARCRVERYGLRPGCESDCEWQAEITSTRPGAARCSTSTTAVPALAVRYQASPGGYNLETCWR